VLNVPVGSANGYLPDSHGRVAFRVDGVGPMVNSPGRATTGTALPSAQYTVTFPHATSVAEVELAGQKYPAEQSPEQADVDKPGTAPYRPAAHTLTTPSTQYDPCGHCV
jgi:hypothetical protein